MARRPSGSVEECPARSRARRGLTSELLEKILDNIPVMVDLIDPSGRIVYVNPEWERVLGWTLDDCDTKDLMQECYPDPAYRDEVLGFVRGGSAEWHEFRPYVRDGRTIITRWANVCLSDGSRIGIGEDITDKRMAEMDLERREEVFRSLIENTSDVLIVVAADGTVLFESPSVARVLGYDPQELVGTSAFDVVHRDDRARLKDVFRAYCENPNESISVEYQAHHKDGSWRLMEARGSRRVEFQGQDGFVISCRNITERRGLEEQLRHAQRLEAVGRLAGGVAHEFSNLLSIILCYSDLLLSRVEAESPLRGDLEQILKAAERGAAVTGQLLAFGRRHIVQPQRLNVNGIVEKLAKVLGPVLGDGIHLDLKLAPDLDDVTVDPVQMEQVLLNLALNARDAMPRGGQISFETSNQIQDDTSNTISPGRYVQLIVSDTGQGMTEQTRAHLFEPFFTTKQRGKGTGLGLSTVYGIIKQHGGSISVESERGRGSRFMIHLRSAR